MGAGITVDLVDRFGRVAYLKKATHACRSDIHFTPENLLYLLSGYHAT